MRREAFDLIMRSCWQPSSIMQLCRSPDSEDALIHAFEVPSSSARNGVRVDMMTEIEAEMRRGIRGHSRDTH